MSPQKYTDAKRDSNRKWDAANLDRVSVAMPRGKRDLIRAAAVAAGESMNQYINGAIDNRLERDGETDIDESRRSLSALREINTTDALLMEIQEAQHLLCGTTWSNVFYNSKLYPTDQDRQAVAAALIECADTVHKMFYSLADKTMPAGADAARLGPGNAKE